MAEKKAEISNINLASGSLNLDDEQIQITGYEGYNKKNSLYLGNQLKNWYKKKFTVPNNIPNAKIIQKWGSNVIWQDGNGTIYKDELPLGTFNTVGFHIEDVTDQWISEPTYQAPSSFSDLQFKIKGDRISFKFLQNGVEKTTEMALAGLDSIGITYGTYSAHGDSIYVTLFNRTNYMSCYYDGSTFIQDEDFLVYSGNLLEKPNVSGSTRVIYDAVSTTYDTATTHHSRNQFGLNEFTFSEILDGNGNGTGGWSRGKRIGFEYDPVNEIRYYALYYNFEQTGISVNNSIVVSNIESIVWHHNQSILYMDSERKLKLLKAVSTPYLECQPIVKDRYLLINTTSYENTIDLVTNGTFCRSDDYNDRCRINTTGDGNYLCVTGWNEQVEIFQDVAFASVYPARIQKGGTITSIDRYSVDDYIPHEVNVYISASAGLTTPLYHNSYDANLGQIKTNFNLTNMYYPMNDYPLYNTSVTAVFNDIYLNYALVDEGGFSFITQIDQYQNMIFGYYPSTYIQLSNLFVIQGTVYGINDQYIVRLAISKSTITDVGVVCNKSDMIYIGATPKTALFFSPMDKSIYLFTGDQSMTKAYDCNRVTDIYSFYNNPATGFIMIATNVGIIGIYNDQIFCMEDIIYDGYLYYTNNCYIIGDTEYTPYKKEDYEVVPVILETKFYGASNEIKSTNDCVYIRLFSENDEPRGQVKVWCETLNEKSAKSNEKIFYADKSKYDPATKSMYLRYQPRFQEATGFRVHIESDFSIMSVSISHKAETVQNSAYNL